MPKKKSEFAKCDYCDSVMMYGVSCHPTILYQGLIYKRIPYKNSYLTILAKKRRHTCHDCNVKLGQYHHLGCDMERCPICGSQLIGCGCFDEEDE